MDDLLELVHAQDEVLTKQSELITKFLENKKKLDSENLQQSRLIVYQRGLIELQEENIQNLLKLLPETLSTPPLKCESPSEVQGR